jgi:hypothetical protein
MVRHAADSNSRGRAARLSIITNYAVLQLKRISGLRKILPPYGLVYTRLLR